MRTLLSLCALALAGRAQAGVELGLGVDGFKDLPDPLPDDRAAFGLGISIRAPARWVLAEGVALRLNPRVVQAAGEDTVTWTEPETGVLVKSDGRAASLLGLELGLGPEVFLGAGRDALVQPYLGAGVSLGLARLTHTFSGEAAASLTGSDKTAVLSASQVVAGSDVHLGVRVAPAERFAMELEAGYNVSFLNEVAVGGAAEASEATVAAFGLNALRLGLGATYSFGDGTVR